MGGQDEHNAGPALPSGIAREEQGQLSCFHDPKARYPTEAGGEGFGGR